MDAVQLQGDAFSGYYLSELLWREPLLKGRVDTGQADRLYRDFRGQLRKGFKDLKGRHQTRSTRTHLLLPLAQLLGWQLGPEEATTGGEEEPASAPLYASEGRIFARVRLLRPEASLDIAAEGQHRRYAPTHSLTQHLEREGLGWGLLLNGYHLRLLRRAEGFVVSWIQFDLRAMAEGTKDGEEAWRLLYSLLRQEALQGDPVAEQVARYSRDHALKINEELGRQVQSALERLLQGILDHPENQRLLPSPLHDQFVQSLFPEALRVLYRCLFALYAESRHLLPMTLSIYRESYALCTLADLAVQPETDPRRLGDPWGSHLEEGLRALFRLLQCGADLGPEGSIPSYGGVLFDPETTYQIERYRWGDGCIADVLDLLTRVPGPRGQGKQRLSYRELSVEQLGSVYERLLELQPTVTTQPMWLIEVDGEKVLVNEATRERLRAQRGEVGLDRTQRAPESGDSKKPIRLLAELPPGRLYLKTGMGRKSSGSYYTRRGLVDFLVGRVIDPLVKEKSAAEILQLRIVDPAMGSGHFLVGACRRLAEHLLAAYRLAGREEAHPRVVRVWEDEEAALAACRLLVAGHCLYGVDKNPQAVELARVSLWLATAAHDQPLTFLDHRLRNGDSLLGYDLATLLRPYRRGGQGRVKGSKKKGGDAAELHQAMLTDASADDLQERLRRALAHLQQVEALAEDHPGDFGRLRSACAAVQTELAPFWCYHQVRVGLFQETDTDETVVNQWLQEMVADGQPGQAAEGACRPAQQSGEEMLAFCWELAFPEVYYTPAGERRADAGFDGVLGNPPWENMRTEGDEFYKQFDPLINELPRAAKEARQAEIRASQAETENEWQEYAALIEAANRFVKESGIYHVLGSGNLDLFKCFAERMLWLLQPRGRVGVVLPDTLHAGTGAADLRRHLYATTRIEALANFENREKLFPIDSRKKFDLLIVQRGEQTTEIPARFFMLREEELLDFDRTCLRLPVETARLLDPEGEALLEFRSEAELTITLRAYRGRTSGPRPTPLGEPGAWQVDFFNEEFHQTRMVTQGLVNRTGDGFPVLHGKAVHQYTLQWEAPQHWITAEAVKEHLGQKELRRIALTTADWLASQGTKVQGKEETGLAWLTKQLGAEPAVEDLLLACQDYRIGYRGVASSTNERTVIAQVVPAAHCVDNGLMTTVDWKFLPSAVRSDQLLRAAYKRTLSLAELTFLLTIFNSFLCDFLVRPRVVSNVYVSLLRLTPVPRLQQGDPLFDAIVPRALRLICESAHYQRLWNTVAPAYPTLPPTWQPSAHASAPLEQAILRAEIDAYVALAYGLSLTEYAFVLSRFPSLDRPQPALPGDLSQDRQPRPRSYVTRDLALLTYCQITGQQPPTDLVACFAEAGADIAGLTGPHRDLTERVALARSLGAVAYRPSAE